MAKALAVVFGAKGRRTARESSWPLAVPANNTVQHIRTYTPPEVAKGALASVGITSLSPTVLRSANLLLLRPERTAASLSSGQWLWRRWQQQHLPANLLCSYVVVGGAHRENDDDDANCTTTQQQLQDAPLPSSSPYLLDENPLLLSRVLLLLLPLPGAMDRVE